MTDLQTNFKYWRQHGRNATAALALARQDIANSKNRYPSSRIGGMRGGEPFKRGSDTMAWFENPGDYLRLTGLSHEILELKYTGWYTEDDGDNGELMRGVVYQLPSRKGKKLFMYGYADPNNDGAACLSLSLADDKEDAARWADSIAEHAAERERGYNRAWQAGRDYEDLGDRVATARRECLDLIAEAKAACAALADFAAIKGTIRGQITEYVHDISKWRKKRRKLLDEYGREPGFSG